MPAYSFKERFVPMVKDGTKTQTVRAYRRHLPKPGQLAYLYYAMRTKHCTRLVDPKKILEVATIWIFKNGRVFIDHELHDKGTAQYLLENMEQQIKAGYANELNTVDKDRFAWLDGFRPDGTSFTNNAGCFDLMLRFWQSTHELPFTGTVTYWQK